MLAFRRLSFVTAVSIIAACGGSGSGTPTGSLVVNKTSLSFSALPSSVAPASQTVTATVRDISGSSLFLRVIVAGGFISVFNIFVTGPSSGQATVSVSAPDSLGPGTHTGTISVVACTTDPNCSGPLVGGSPQTITVTYTIPAVQADVVAPYVVSAGVPGEVVLRGNALPSMTGVTFGAEDATGFVQISATEIRARYPALSAGTYPIRLQNASGPVPFSANLVVVRPVVYAPTTLSYPSPNAANRLSSLIYDAERQAILVAMNGDILRYAFVNPAWQAPLEGGFLQKDITLSNDGTELLGLSEVGVSRFDPATLAQRGNLEFFSNVSSALNKISLANDGIALVTGKEFDVYLYATASRAVFRTVLNGALKYPDGTLKSAIIGALPGSGENRSAVVFIQDTNTPDDVFKYSAQSALFSATGLLLNRISPVIEDRDSTPAVDRSGTRIALNTNTEGVGLFDQSMTRIANFPPSSATVAFAPNPAGAAIRAYTLDSCKLRAFDLRDVSAGLVEIANATYPIFLPDCPGNHPRIVMTPDGGNAILAGDTQVVIVPTP